MQETTGGMPQVNGSYFRSPERELRLQQNIEFNLNHDQHFHRVLIKQAYAHPDFPTWQSQLIENTFLDKPRFAAVGYTSREIGAVVRPEELYATGYQDVYLQEEGQKLWRLHNLRKTQDEPDQWVLSDGGKEEYMLEKIDNLITGAPFVLTLSSNERKDSQTNSAILINPIEEMTVVGSHRITLPKDSDPGHSLSKKEQSQEGFREVYQDMPSSDVAIAFHKKAEQVSANPLKRVQQVSGAALISGADMSRLGELEVISHEIFTNDKPGYEVREKLLPYQEALIHALHTPNADQYHYALSLVNNLYETSQSYQANKLAQEIFSKSIERIGEVAAFGTEDQELHVKLTGNNESGYHSQEDVQISSLTTLLGLINKQATPNHITRQAIATIIQHLPEITKLNYRSAFVYEAIMLHGTDEQRHGFSQQLKSILRDNIDMATTLFNSYSTIHPSTMRFLRDELESLTREIYTDSPHDNNQFLQAHTAVRNALDKSYTESLRLLTQDVNVILQKPHQELYQKISQAISGRSIKKIILSNSQMFQHAFYEPSAISTLSTMLRTILSSGNTSEQNIVRRFLGESKIKQTLENIKNSDDFIINVYAAKLLEDGGFKDPLDDLMKKAPHYGEDEKSHVDLPSLTGSKVVRFPGDYDEKSPNNVKNN